MGQDLLQLSLVIGWYTSFGTQCIFICSFVKNQANLVLFLLLDLRSHDMCDSVNFIHLTYLILPHYLVKLEPPKCM